MDGGLGAIFSGIGAAFIFADIVSKLQDVPDEARRFSTLINRVRLDYNEALRLWSHPAVQTRFEADPPEHNYVRGTISSVKNALADIGIFVEKIRLQDNGGLGSVSMLKRSEWLWRYRSKVDSSERVLDTSHKSMLAAVGRMVTWINMAPMAVTLARVPSIPPTGLLLPGPGPPPYQEAVAADARDMDDGFIMARRRMTKNDRREKTPRTNDVNVTVTPTIPTPTETTIHPFDAIPEMSAVAHGPVEMVYAATPASIVYATPAPSTYTPSGLEPLPPFRDAQASLTPMASMVSLRAEYNSFAASTPTASARASTASRWQSSQYASSSRGYAQNVAQSAVVSEAGSVRYRDRPRSNNASRRDQQGAMSRLSSGRYDL